MRARTNQGGWIVNYVVIGLVLVVGAVAGIIFLKSQYTPVEIADNNNQGATQQADDEKAGSADDSEDSKNQEEAEKQPAKEKDAEKQDERNQATKQDDAKSSDDTLKSGHNDDAAKEDADALPATGPEDALAAMVILGLLTYSAVLYRQSRRQS